jgi:drug/metabolite transporter (DMT)-like permease
LAVVAVLGSLYPATTVLLARFLLHERLIRIQLLGVYLAFAAVAALALG